MPSPKSLLRPVVAVGPRRVQRVYHFALFVAAGDVVGTGEDDAPRAVPPRRFVQVMQAADVGLQDRLERAFDRNAAQVNHGIDAFQQCMHGRGVGQFARAQFGVVDRAPRGHRRGEIAEHQRAADRAQRFGQHAAQRAGSAGEQQAAERRGD